MLHVTSFYSLHNTSITCDNNNNITSYDPFIFIFIIKWLAYKRMHISACTANHGSFKMWKKSGTVAFLIKLWSHLMYSRQEIEFNYLHTFCFERIFFESFVFFPMCTLLLLTPKFCKFVGPLCRHDNNNRFHFHPGWHTYIQYSLYIYIVIVYNIILEHVARRAPGSQLAKRSFRFRSQKTSAYIRRCLRIMRYVGAKWS